MTTMAVAVAASGGSGAVIAGHPYALAGECIIGATIESFKYANPNNAPGLNALDAGLDAYDILTKW